MSGGTASVQVRNSEMVDILSTDFLKRNEATVAWGKAASLYLMLPGLRGFWPMSSIDEGGNVFDLSEQGRTLSYNGNPMYNLVGLAPYIDLDGAGDYLSRGDEAGLDITGGEAFYAAALRGLTVGGWFRHDALGADEGLIGKHAGVGNYGYILWKPATNLPSFEVSGDGTTLVAATAASTVSATNWYFYAGRYDPSTSVDVFVNNVKATNAVGVPASIFNNNAALVVGGYGNPVGNLLAGWASLCFLTATALPDRVITALYEHTRNLFGQ